MQRKQEQVGIATTTEKEEYPHLKKPSIRKVLHQEQEKRTNYRSLTTSDDGIERKW